MESITFSRPEMKSHLKKTDKDAQGVSRWERWFNDTSRIFQEQTESTFTGIDKNVGDVIAKAYGQYQKQSMNLSKNPYLLSGFADKHSNLMANSDFGGLVEDTKLQGAQAKMKTAYEMSDSFNQTILGAEKELDKKAELMQRLHPRLQEFSGLSVDEMIEKGYYVVANGAITLTDRGRMFYDQLLNEGKASDGGKMEQFSDYLKDDDDLYTGYLDNYDEFKQVVAGLEPGDNAFDFEGEYPKQYEEQKINENKEALDKKLRTGVGATVDYEKPTKIENIIKLGHDTETKNKFREILTKDYTDYEVVELSYNQKKHSFVYYNNKFYEIKSKPAPAIRIPGMM